MINLELYRIFYIVAETNSITKASEILNISQPAVTKQIKNLEEELNTPLFNRTKKGVTLNECGQKIFLKVKHALNLLDEAEKEYGAYNNLTTGTIKIGTSTSLIRNYLLKYIETFHNKYPNIIVEIHTDPTKEMIQKLKNGALDIIIGKYPDYIDKELQYTELSKTRYIFVANKNYFDIHNPIKAQDLEKLPILLQKAPSNSRAHAEEFFKKNHIALNPLMNIGSSNLLIDFIKLGYGVGYVTELYVKDMLESKELYKIETSPESEDVSFGIISLKNNLVTSHCTKFIECI